jgi:hypothetical protein
MNEIEQRTAAEEPLYQFTAEFPGRTRRRVVFGLVAVFVVVVLVVWAALFVGMNSRIHKLDRTTATQASQIRKLQTDIATVSGSLGAAVACLQTVGTAQGLCSKLVK